MLPGRIMERLHQALDGPLSGAVLVVTPDIVLSGVVKSVELPRLPEPAEEHVFTFSVVGALTASSDPPALDFTAPDRLLGTAPGTLSAFLIGAAGPAGQLEEVAARQARRRVELLAGEIWARGALTVDVQTRHPRGENRDDRDLVIRLPGENRARHVDEQRRRHPPASADAAQPPDAQPERTPEVMTASRVLARHTPRARPARW